MLPYALLLSRDLKRNMGKLRVIATWISVAASGRLLLALCAGVPQGGFSFSVLDVAAAARDRRDLHLSVRVDSFGGRSLLPVNDPDLDKALHHHVH
jgi:hypothetical protein